MLPQVLRDTLNCTLPIEIIYNGPAEMDLWAINKFQVRPLALLHKGQLSSQERFRSVYSPVQPAHPSLCRFACLIGGSAQGSGIVNA